MAGVRRAAGVRERGATPRPALRCAQGARTARDRHEDNARRRRDRRRRGRARRPRVQVFFVRSGRIAGRKGYSRRGRRGADAGRPSRARSIQSHLRRAGRGPRRGARPVRAREPRGARGVADDEARSKRVRIRVPKQGTRAPVLAAGRGERGAVAPGAPIEAADRPRRAVPRAPRPPGGARAPGSPTAHRVLRHLDAAGRGDGRIDGRLRGRRPEEERLPQVPREAAGRHG